MYDDAIDAVIDKLTSAVGNEWNNGVLSEIRRAR